VSVGSAHANESGFILQEKDICIIVDGEKYRSGSENNSLTATKLQQQQAQGAKAPPLPPPSKFCLRANVFLRDSEKLQRMRRK